MFTNEIKLLQKVKKSSDDLDKKLQARKSSGTGVPNYISNNSQNLDSSKGNSDIQREDDFNFGFAPMGISPDIGIITIKNRNFTKFRFDHVIDSKSVSYYDGNVPISDTYIHSLTGLAFYFTAGNDLEGTYLYDDGSQISTRTDINNGTAFSSVLFSSATTTRRFVFQSDQEANIFNYSTFGFLNDRNSITSILPINIAERSSYRRFQSENSLSLFICIASSEISLYRYSSGLMVHIKTYGNYVGNGYSTQTSDNYTTSVDTLTPFTLDVSKFFPSNIPANDILTNPSSRLRHIGIFSSDFRRKISRSSNNLNSMPMNVDYKLTEIE